MLTTIYNIYLKKDKNGKNIHCTRTNEWHINGWC